MAKKKASTTILVHPILGERSFDSDHADRIMAMENNGGWERKSKSNGQSGDNKGTDKESEE